MAASFLDRLVNGVKEAASGPGLQDLTQKARAGWDRQDNMTKGADLPPGSFLAVM